MLRMNEDFQGALEEYCRLLESEDFFEAHEILEEAWHPLRLREDPLRHSFKALINAAIAFEHLRRDRPKSRRVASRAMEGYERRIGEEGCIQDAVELVERLREAWRI